MFGIYWWTLLPAITIIAWPLAKGKGEQAERFDDKKQTSAKRREDIFNEPSMEVYRKNEKKSD